MRNADDIVTVKDSDTKTREKQEGEHVHCKYETRKKNNTKQSVLLQDKRAYIKRPRLLSTLTPLTSFTIVVALIAS